MSFSRPHYIKGCWPRCPATLCNCSYREEAVRMEDLSKRTEELLSLRQNLEYNSELRYQYGEHMLALQSALDASEAARRELEPVEWQACYVDNKGRLMLTPPHSSHEELNEALGGFEALAIFCRQGGEVWLEKE